MLKYMLAYHIWDKRDMLAWLLDGIARHFDPKRCEVALYFDACTDGSEGSYYEMKDFFLTSRGFKESSGGGVEEIFEVGSHLKLIDRFIRSDADVLIVPQDDQRFERPILSYLDSLFEFHQDGVGVISGNAGWNENFKDMVESEFSVTDLDVPKRKLFHGEFPQRLYLNSGPIIYNRNLLTKAGPPCAEFKAFNVWIEHCMRATKAGLTNFVVGMDITHAKFGRVSKSKLYEPLISQHDNALLERKRKEHGL